MVDGTPLSGIGGAPAGDGPYDFVVSHAAADREWAEWIAWQLRERLLLDNRQPKPFLWEWNSVPDIHEVVGEAARVIAVLTPDYLPCADNIEAWSALWPDDPGGFRRQVVPVRVGECQPGWVLGTNGLVDLVDLDAVVATDALLSGIGASLAGRARPVVPATRVGPLFPGPPVLVGEPPTIPPNRFQDRYAEVEDVERHLRDDRTRLVRVVGPEGYGKTAMVHRLWERVRVGASPLRVHGLVYLSGRGFELVTADLVIEKLTALFPAHEAEELRAAGRRSLPLERLVMLLDALSGLDVIIAIDAVEDLLDDDDDIADPALRELVDHLASRAGLGVWLLLVGRRPARAVADRFPGTPRPRHLTEGLPVDDAFALLRAMNADDTLRFGDVPERDRERLHEVTRGCPRALELVYGLLVSGHFTLPELLELMSRMNVEDVVVGLLAEACARLSPSERRVLQALAVYGRPVPVPAVDHLVRGELDSPAILERLRHLRLARCDGEHFSVPAPTERDRLIELEAGETPVALLRRAAAYYAGQRTPAPRGLTDLRPQLIEIELALRAGDHEAAFQLMGDVDDHHLAGWGSSTALTPALRMLLHADIPTKLEIDAESMYGRALLQQERHAEATDHLEHALVLASGRRRIVLRRQLSAAYLHQGDLPRATARARRACLAAFARLSSRDVMKGVAALAMCRGRAGAFTSALRLFRVAGWLLERVGTADDQVHQPTMLLGEAWVHGQLGDRDRARRLLREARSRAEDIGNRRWAGRCLLAEAEIDLDDGDPDQAIALAGQAYEIGVHHGNRRLCRVAMEIRAIAQLEQGDFADAARAADIARRTRGSVLGLGLVGLAAYRRGANDDAQAAFRAGCAEARACYYPNETDFQFLDAYGLVACGLGLLGESTYLGIARTMFGRARAIAPVCGAVTRVLMLLKHFESHLDREEFARVWAAARGRTETPLTPGSPG